MPRTALIVDDSRTALVSLGRVLQGQGINVDMVESGSEALDHLRGNAHHGVIFLDHMMPGMDGFETLAALKSNPRTAAIPVVMYTTKDGDAYMGQAISQGAIGVLHKPVNPAELSVILQRVDRLRSSTGEAGISPTGLPRAAVTGVIDVPAEFQSVAPATPTAAMSRSKATVTASTETRAPASRTPQIRKWLVRTLLGIVLLLPAAWYYQRYQQSNHQRLELSAEIERLRSERLAQVEALAVQVANEKAARPDSQNRRAMLDVLAWALNLRGQYDFGVEPLNDARANQLRELVARLAAAGYQGTVRLETRVGEFCVARDDQGAYRLPENNLPFNRCEVLRYPPAQAEYLGRRQSPAFTRFLAQQNDGPVRIEILTHGSSRPVMSYPDLASTQTAGDWNKTARLNQRVDVVLVPAPSPSPLSGCQL